ncbi:MAG TPA: DHA2 family efflux MFS transporter permease subunit [Caulobacteraceae bacterium]|nr:DHA2 family efflux MFS transporter permease subunit [Caulobacteraceae bacterium]
MNGAPTGDPNRTLITVSIMLATVMNSLDTTIANVALPHMMGSVSASADEITWVLTSYIVAAAILTPLTGWLAGRLGRKTLFMISIAGFTFASALCGAAQNLPQIVIFRLLQGAFGACLIPLSQAVLLDIYPLEEQGPAMAIWGMGTLLGPIIGPTLGGWLTDNLSWRWVFYINLPLGALAFLGVMTFIHDHKSHEKVPFDFMGFGFLSLAIGSFQLFLDRGQDKAWFESTEIWIEATIAGLALFLFAVHSATAKRPFVPPELIANRNFMAATIFGFFLGLLLYSTLALLPPMLETLMGYPVTTTGLVSLPRGVGSFIAMFFVGRIVNRVDARAIIVFGLSLSLISAWGMTSFALGMDAHIVIWTSFVQGLGTGFIFIPLTTLGFATIDPKFRPDASGVFTLARNLGSSAGISIMQALLTQNAAMVHARLTEGLTPDNLNYQSMTSDYSAAGSAFSLTNPAGAAAINGVVNQQATMVAYIDDFKLMMITTMALAPLLFFMRPPSRTLADSGSLVLE